MLFSLLMMSSSAMSYVSSGCLIGASGRCSVKLMSNLRTGYRRIIGESLSTSVR